MSQKKVRNILKRMQNQFSKFCEFCFANIDIVYFVLKILSELGTLSPASSTLCKPDTETLTSDTR